MPTTFELGKHQTDIYITIAVENIVPDTDRDYFAGIIIVYQNSAGYGVIKPDQQIDQKISKIELRQEIEWMLYCLICQAKNTASFSIKSRKNHKSSSLLASLWQYYQ